jgi:hypothetical protein
MSLRLQNLRLRSCVLFLMVLGLQTALSGADLQRPFDPVVIQGRQIHDFLGSDTSEVFVYAYKAGGWVQIPFQVDQVDKDSTGVYSYFAPHNAVIDTTDEICFMAADMGDSVGDNRWIGDIGSTLYQRYQVAAWDTSVVPSRKAYAYVYRSSSITPVFASYMTYVPGAVGHSDTVQAVTYTCGQNADAIPDFLSLKDGETSGPDILDRWKIRFEGRIGLFTPIYTGNEDDALRDTTLQVRAGPIRVIHHPLFDIYMQGISTPLTQLPLEIIYYPWSYKLDLIKETLPGYLGMTKLRQTVDYLPNIAGSQFHWSKGTNIPVDGVLDNIVDKTFEVPGVNWYMVQGEFGTAATIFEMDTIDGTQLSLYYLDDASKIDGGNRADTGDSLAYAESGVQLSALTESIDINKENLSATFYFLPEYHTAAYGDSLADYSRHPLQIVVMPRTNTVIPVEMTALKGQLNKGSVQLEWTTVTESNNYGFDIERRNSADAEWQKMGFVKGHGTSQTAHAYQFIDSQPVSGMNYYRLKQIDLDGRSTYSAEVAVSLELPEKLGLAQNYPNPFNPGTDISFQVPAGALQRVNLAIFNLLGQKIRTLVDKQLESGIHHIQWDGRDERGQNAVSGAYIYRLQMGNQILTRKMIKMQ